MDTQAPNRFRGIVDCLARHWITIALHLLIILAVVAGYAALWWVDTLPTRVDEQQTVVVGQTRFAPGSDASVRVVVQDLGKGRPIANAHVKVSLKPAQGRAITLYEGETDETGSAPVTFRVPGDAPANATLVVETESAAGRDQMEQPVTFEREYRLLLTSDKPLYQPGQTIHMRALALSAFDLAPARGATINFLVEDPRGNKVFRKSVEASEFGVVAADFALADVVNQGNYKLSVSMGDIAESATRSEKTVEVRPYVLPKFGVSVSTDRGFYLPGQRVEGVVQADYFFGKPVAEGQVQIVGSVWDVERTVVVELHGQTDENGAYRFGFDLPDYFAGSGLESGQAQFALEVTVVDQTDHPEQASRVLPIAAEPLIIEAVAESGVLKPGVENIVYILTSYPDGRPAPTQLQVSVDGGKPAELSTGEFGLAEFAFTPQAGGHPYSFSIVAQDETGLKVGRRVSFEAEYGSDSVLLRADRAAYIVGETMRLVALTPVEYGDIYLDIARGGQTLSTRSAKVQSGKAEFAVDVSPDLFGTLELHAYKVLLDGTIVRDTRIVVVDASNAVTIDIAANADLRSVDTYLPGEVATIDFRTAGEEGGLQTALGIAIVDESVFALQQQDPGFAKLYFMLEQELMEPFYQVKGFELPASIPPDKQDVRRTQDNAAKATWAGVPATDAQAINSRQEKMVGVLEAQAQEFVRVGETYTAGLALVPLAIGAVALVALARSEAAKLSLKRLLAASLYILMGGGVAACWLIPVGLAASEALAILLIVLFGLGVLVLGVYAWAGGDPAARLLALLTVAGGAVLLMLFRVVDEVGELPEGVIGVGWLALLLVPVAYLLFGQTRWVQGRRFAGGLATGLGALSALPALLILPGLLFPISMMRMAPGAPEMAVVTKVVEKEGEAVKEAMATATPAPEEAAWDEADASVGEEGVIEEQAAPRLRQYFPETLYWAPEVVTDEDGFVSLEIPMADSITTWRLTALATSQDGRLGFATRGVRVFQDFFVDIDLPVALTQGDEISIPVGVFNYLPEAQEVRLEVKEEGWFELLGEKEQTLTIASNDIEVVYFPIRVIDFGRRGFQVTAWGESMSDAIRREVTVVPDGKEIRATTSDWLRESKEIALDISADAVPDTPYVEVKIYPGVMAQAVEGLEKILRLPDG